MNFHIRIRTKDKAAIFDWISKNDESGFVFRCVAYEGLDCFYFKISISDEVFLNILLEFCRNIIILDFFLGLIIQRVP